MNIATAIQFPSLQFRSKTSIIYLIIPLTLSAFTHLWNPIGFPVFEQDEGHYMRRAMQVMEGFGPHESKVTFFLDMITHTLANYFWPLLYPC